jgi:hypothetical protein
MSPRPAAEVVQSLFGQLESVEQALGQYRELVASTHSGGGRASEFAELETAASALEAVARDIVRQIEAHVEASSAAGLFGIDVLL